MAHPTSEEIYPVNTIVRLKDTGEFAIIVDRVFLMGQNFLHYLGKIDGRGDAVWCLIHDRIELEVK